MPDIATTADTILSAFKEHRQIQPFGDLDLEAARAVGEEIRRRREADGEKAIGRKIGFTNRTIWDEYGVYAPIWGYMYDTTVHELSDTPFDLSPYLEPLVEPEICFGLSSTPEPDMSDADLVACIDWVAHGFEIVQSMYPGWRFQAGDAMAAFALHGAYLIGPRQPLEELPVFNITLESSGGVVEHGTSTDVLGGPLHALRHIIDTEPRHSPGEMVTTGTLTRALPVSPGETWRTTLSGIALEGIEASFF